MQAFRNILFVQHCNGTGIDGLRQALILSRANGFVPVTALILHPGLPTQLRDYQTHYEQTLKDALKQNIESVCGAHGIAVSAIPLDIVITEENKPAVTIIRHVLRNAIDVVIKQADETATDRKGFKALDMDLLRQCPCPVWLCRPEQNTASQLHIAVAIDPDSEQKVGHDLSLRLLTLSRSLADGYEAQLSIVSCWRYEYEGYLRHNPWIPMQDNKIEPLIDEEKTRHRMALDSLVTESGITTPFTIHHLEGKAEAVIPSFVTGENIDILIMGTVARTGIEGFIIGNTAENILRGIDSSLIALKPNGFISPVKAY